MIEGGEETIILPKIKKSERRCKDGVVEKNIH